MSTYTPIASVSLASASNSVVLGSIPQNYTDLVFVISYSQNASTALTGIVYRFNSDSSAVYSTNGFQNGSPALAYRYNNVTRAEVAYQVTNGNSHIISQICGYSNSSITKTVISRHGNAGGLVQIYTNSWRNTAAITSITITCDAGSFAAGTTFNLYGIANASIASKATGGDIVTTDGTYWYHTFLSSGTFTPTQALTADYLVIAGGGGGAGQSNLQEGVGGGGAGGLRCTVGATGGGGSLESPLSLTAQAYTVTIGAGGTAGSGATAGTNGSNSVFSTITSTGGGVGARIGNTAGTGGSGGGAEYGTAGSGTANQGFAGANTGGAQRGGGGGGAGAAGSTGITTGAGGNGVTTSISGSSVTYAGGGGGGGSYTAGALPTGGAGGSGGGGAGGNGNYGSGTAGTINTGSGGGAGAGGNAGTSLGGAGGSGIVIVRYAV